MPMGVRPYGVVMTARFTTLRSTRPYHGCSGENPMAAFTRSATMP